MENKKCAKGDSATPRTRRSAKKSAAHHRSIRTTKVVGGQGTLQPGHQCLNNKSTPCKGDCGVAPETTQTVHFAVEPIQLKVKLAFIYLYMLVWVITLYGSYKLSLWVGRSLFGLA